jgi:hypothetical protein
VPVCLVLVGAIRLLPQLGREVSDGVVCGDGAKNSGNRRDLPYTSSIRDACRSSTRYGFATEPPRA